MVKIGNISILQFPCFHVSSSVARFVIESPTASSLLKAEIIIRRKPSSGFVLISLEIFTPQ
jgi:hypothetical protein